MELNQNLQDVDHQDRPIFKLPGNPALHSWSKSEQMILFLSSDRVGQVATRRVKIGSEGICVPPCVPCSASGCCCRVEPAGSNPVPRTIGH